MGGRLLCAQALTRLPPDFDPGVGTLPRTAGEGGPGPKGWVGEGCIFSGVVPKGFADD